MVIEPIGGVESDAPEEAAAEETVTFFKYMQVKSISTTVDLIVESSTCQITWLRIT